jgi:tRNA nucleotidyltransferase/poly(A) polymerase
MEIIKQTILGDVEGLGGKIYLVGGSVRDQLFKIEGKSKDIDIVVTGVPYVQLKQLLSAKGQLDEVGKSFGVIKWQPTGRDDIIDVALPRKEVSVGEGHQDFDVHFDHTLRIEDDLIRRDFTINAIAIDLSTGKRVDPHQGLPDIKARDLRMIGANSFQDDPLRILRGLQFVARFNLSIVHSTQQSMAKHSHLIRHISKERVATELVKLFGKGQAISKALSYMKSADVWERIFPEIQIPDILIDKPVLNSTELKLAAIFAYGKARSAGRTGEDIAQESLLELKLASAGVDCKKIVKLVAASSKATPTSKAEQARLISKELSGSSLLMFDLLRLRSVSKHASPVSMAEMAAFTAEIERELYPLALRDLAVNGTDIQALGAEGPVIGSVLEALLDVVLDHPKQNTRADLLEIAAALIVSAAG